MYTYEVFSHKSFKFNYRWINQSRFSNAIVNFQILKNNLPQSWTEELSNRVLNDCFSI